MTTKLKKDAFANLLYQERKELISRDIKVGVIDEDKVNSEIYDDDAVALQKLINDIKSVGLSAPLTVRRNKEYTDRYILVAGHRRLKALKALGYTIVPCMVVKTDNEEDELKADIMHLTSNIMTRERSLMERAKEAKLLKQRIKALKEVNPEAYKGKTDEIVAKMLNVTSSYVRQLIRVDNADEEIKELLKNEMIGVSQALKLDAMDEVERTKKTDTIKRNIADKSLNNIPKEEKSIDDIIASDLAKIQKLMKKTKCNLSKSSVNYIKEMDTILELTHSLYR